MKSKLVALAFLSLTLAGSTFAQDYDHHEADAHRAAAQHRVHERERMHRDARDDRMHHDQMANGNHDDQMAR
ncbi:hypothetical protein R75461_08367 [Paraburkholderia nemoris]|uniref:hypothetical protein n=1 Tax=Paraburkholderia nemoris TaxID=2793076 RepID=UPI00190AFBFF|nr:MULTISPECIES: hypothetical protein [Paraburkholderia]MBK3787140.1 hypothetical protein [Paraburkholderia aspalathi]CAE6867419.1 hypothetical protein R75461_08367 [Paraburkholderia nemoris]